MPPQPIPFLLLWAFGWFTVIVGYEGALGKIVAVTFVPGDLEVLP